MSFGFFSRALLALASILWSGIALADRANGPAQANNHFGFDLYEKIPSQSGNVVFSPHSIAEALALVHAGARGKTAAAMSKVLHIPLSKPEWVKEELALDRTLQTDGNRGGQKLSIANALWLAKDLSIAPGYLQAIAGGGETALSRADFRTDPERVRQSINAWVEEVTAHKITGLIPSGMISRETLLAVVNAVYFKGDWAHPFEKEATREEPFKLHGGKSISIPTLRQAHLFPYAENKEWQAIELPYRDGGLSMVILLPRADSLAALDKLLSGRELDAALETLSPVQVDLALPKFKVSGTLRLREQLSALGMANAFGAQADFSGIAENLFISEVIHKAYVAVDERGTEAAAATAIVMEGNSLQMGPRKIFHADHPFLFLIRHQATGAILFLGRVANPKN